MPPSAMTVCALPSSDLQMSPTETPAADASMAARRPAPPAPITITSCSCVSKSMMNHMRSNNPQVAPDAHGTKANVQVGEADHEQGNPGPFHVLFVEGGAAAPHLVAEVGFAGAAGATEALEAAAHQMTHRVAAEREPGQANDVGDHDECAEADTELMAAGGIAELIEPRPAKRQQRVPGQQHQENQ